MPRCQTRLLTCLRPLALALLALAVPAGALRADDAARTARNQELRAHIAMLIEALGADEYAVRERAQNELASLGPVAFDDLLVARGNSDIEIAQRAQYLIERMGIALVNPEDPLEVRQILGEYDDLASEERIRRMQQLTQLEDWLGAAALCQLVRYDDTEQLSKTAALLLLTQAPPESPERRAELAETLETTIQFSARPAAAWVRAYADTLRDPAQSLPKWHQIIDQEWSEYREDPREVERQLLRDLVRWQVDLLDELDQDEASLAAMESTLELIEPTPPELLETVGWLMTRQAWATIDKLYDDFGEVCQGNPELVYRLAEVRRKQGNEEEAEELAATARGLDPENMHHHDLLARLLRERGMIDWAEAEYRYILEEVEAGSVEDVWFRVSFAELLHDQLRDGEAAEVLEPAVECLRDQGIAATLQGMGINADNIVSRAHYFSACHFAAQGDWEKQTSHLQVAIARDPFDLDTIIALYNLPEQDARQRRQTLSYLERARDLLYQRVEMLELRASREIQGARLEAYDIELAKWCNQYAWLVCNTEGDLQEALRCSELSLELTSGNAARRAGYLDTLAHCYFALGDYEQAVEIQREAVELEPHSGQIVRELERFETELAERQAAEPAE